MGRRGNRSQTRLNDARREETGEREALERRWHRQLAPRPELAKLVTGQTLSTEPFHRWLPYQQAFSPELVRLFLREANPQDVSDEHPLLDPFAGVGTLVVECVRNNIAAVGLEALEPLTLIVVVIPWRAAAISGALAIATALAAGILPALRAARLDPAEAMRCE